MKIWLPDSLYRLKPFLLGFAGTVFLYVSEDMFTTVLALLCHGIRILDYCHAFIVVVRSNDTGTRWLYSSREVQKAHCKIS